MTAAPRGAAEAAPATRLGVALADGLAALLDREVPAAVWDRALAGPLLEFAGRPGKELRSQLTELAWTLAGGAGAVPAALPVALEALHAGSLIVDDVQDGATERRGGPALHALCGVPLAINTGTWMYFWALDAIAGVGGAPAAQVAMHRLAVSTLLACHQGQALDLSVRADELDPARAAAVVGAITRGKSAALMGLGPRLAATAAGAPPPVIDALGALGEALGTALQMLDDLGGLGLARRAKGHEDLRAGRATWPWAWLAATIDHLGFVRLQHRARAAAERGDPAELDAIADALRGEVDGVGRACARRVLDRAVTAARALVGDAPALRELVAHVDRLEESYG